MEASSEIELRAGAEYPLVLGGSGSTGYVWEYDVVGSRDVIRIRDGMTEVPPADMRLQNYSVNQTYIIEALAPGKAEAKFVFRRPWEKDGPPLQVKSIRVSVIK